MKTRSDLFSRAPAHVQRALHDLRHRLAQEIEDDKTAAQRRARALRAAEQRETWEEIKEMTTRLK